MVAPTASVMRVFVIAGLHSFISVNIERPAFDEVRTLQPAAILNVTARHAHGIGVRQRLACCNRIGQQLSCCSRFTAMELLGTSPANDHQLQRQSTKRSGN
jgi:hypothetical protein